VVKGVHSWNPTVVCFTCVNRTDCSLSRSISIAACLLAVLAGSLCAQLGAPPQPTNDVAFLLRLERVRSGLDVCVIVRGNGQYHLERHLPDKARIFEGNLDADETRQLIRIVSTDQLYRLTQSQISDPMLRSGFDQVVLSVLRPSNIWQRLAFPDSQSREPYHESLTPLLDWLDKLQKRKEPELPEETARNNCLPPRNPELSVRTRNGQNSLMNEPERTRTPATATTPQAGTSAQESLAIKKSYLLKMLELRSRSNMAEVSCIVISASGKYHFVKQTDEPNSTKVRSAVLDGVLNETQTATLGQILDAPELRSTSSEKPPPVFMGPISGEGIHVSFSFSREGTLYKNEAWRSLQVVGRTITANLQEHGMKALVPLQEWMKINIDQSKATSSANPPNSRCLQEP
jgi:hypothetical protein